MRPAAFPRTSLKIQKKIQHVMASPECPDPCLHTLTACTIGPVVAIALLSHVSRKRPAARGNGTVRPEAFAPLSARNAVGNGQ